MDFGTILHVAKKNNENQKDSSRFYSTKFAPPKKESKETKLSENIKKFLEKQHEEERRKKEQERKKLANLLSMRDEKSKNKIKKMLKVTKSANKSVLDDVIRDHTAVTIEGPDQPDQDDYGYVSNEANAFYQKYIEKVKDVKDDKGFAPSRPQSLKDLAGTKERVKAAITKETEDKKLCSRQSSSHTKAPSSGPSLNGERHRSSSKPLYDADAERKEAERKKKEDQQEKARSRKPLPPPMDFQALLKLAEKKQHEPVEFVPVIKKKEPERLLTMKEKRELEERQKTKEKKIRESKEVKNLTNLVAPLNRTKSNAAEKTDKKKIDIKDKDKIESRSCKGVNAVGKVFTSTNVMKTSVNHTKPNLEKKNEESTLKRLKSTYTSAPQLKPDSKSGKPLVSFNKSSSSSLKDPNSSLKKLEKAAPSKEPKAIGTRQFPPQDIRKNSLSNSGGGTGNFRSQKNIYKRRILDDDEYDSEMDDFIDDGDCEEDYSVHIKEIFGYDKNKYKFVEDDDDAAMESNFAQVQREEYISKKIGLQEDLEDMKMEALEKKRKLMKKKKLR